MQQRLLSPTYLLCSGQPSLVRNVQDLVGGPDAVQHDGRVGVRQAVLAGEGVCHLSLQGPQVARRR